MRQLNGYGEGFKPFQLTTLQNMLRFYADKFVRLMAALQHIQTENLAVLRIFLEAEKKHGWDAGRQPPLNPQLLDIRDLEKNLVEMGDLCREMGLKSSAKQAQKMQVKAATGAYYERQFKADIEQLQTRIDEDLTDSLCLLVPQQIAERYYDNPECLSAGLVVAFPSLRDEIEEAGNCFATGRYTGCVVHLARIMEAGVLAYAGWLGVVVDPDSMSWGSVLGDTFRKIGDNTKGKAWITPEHETFARGCQAFFSAAKTAIRDPGAHIVRLYDEPKALRVFNAVEAFMGHLAEHLDEVGTFTP